MKKLTLIRHAKSSWDGNLRDFDRPLSIRGIKDLSNMVAEVRTFDYAPDLVLSSPANRALATANFFVEGLGIPSKKFSTDKALYDFSGQSLIATIKDVQDSVDFLMVFGHNHALTYFVNLYGTIPIDNVPTCGLVTIEFPITHWNDLKKGVTSKTLFPKSLRNKL